MANVVGSIASEAALLPHPDEAQRGSIPETIRKGGPRTVAGKRRSSLNRLGNGLYANAILLKGEDREHFLQFARATVAGLDVRNALEMACAERIVSALWRGRRARRYEQAHLNKASDEAEDSRKALDGADHALVEYEHAIDAVQRLANADRMTAGDLNDAASAVFNALSDFMPALESQGVVDYWDLWPDRGMVSRKRVAWIAGRVRALLRSTLSEQSAYEFWSYVLQQMGPELKRLRARLKAAAAAHQDALSRTYLLDATQADPYVAETRAGRVLDDAERRLDRQVTRAIADLEAARRLRL